MFPIAEVNSTAKTKGHDMAPPKQTRTAVEKVARSLRQLALSTAEGGLVGSEEELVRKLQVSRPTLRQAAALLSQEQLLTIRRGVGGGYFSQRPGSRAVAHIAAIYLQTRGTTMGEIIHAIEPINIELATLASRNREPEMIAKWVDFIQRDDELRAGGKFADFQKSQVEFIKLVCLASGNRVLELFVLTLYDFCGSARPEEDLMAQHPNRVAAYWERRNELVQAILKGDSEIAEVTARRCARMVSNWLTEGAAHKDANGKEPADWAYVSLKG